MRAKQQLLMIITGLVLALPSTATSQPFDPSKTTIFNSNEIADTTYGEHGGLVVRRENFLFESVVGADGIRIFVYEAPKRRLDPQDARGNIRLPLDSGGFATIILEHRRDAKNPPDRFRNQQPKRGYHLFAPADLSLQLDGSSRWRAVIDGLPGQSESSLRYSHFFAMTRLKGWCCRGHEHRVMLAYKDYPLCEKEYLDPAPFLYQCPEHEHSRSDRESTCPICGKTRIATRQTLHGHQNKPPPKTQRQRNQ